MFEATTQQHQEHIFDPPIQKQTSLYTKLLLCFYLSSPYFSPPPFPIFLLLSPSLFAAQGLFLQPCSPLCSGRAGCVWGVNDMPSATFTTIETEFSCG